LSVRSTVEAGVADHTSWDLSVLLSLASVWFRLVRYVAGRVISEIALERRPPYEETGVAARAELVGDASFTAMNITWQDGDLVVMAMQ
jgi:hypothetical protein